MRFRYLGVRALELPHLRDVLFQVLDAFPFEEHSRNLDAVRPGELVVLDRAPGVSYL